MDIGFAQVRADITGLRDGLHADITDARNQSHSEILGLRDKMDRQFLWLIGVLVVSGLQLVLRFTTGR